MLVGVHATHTDQQKSIHYAQWAAVGEYVVVLGEFGLVTVVCQCLPRLHVVVLCGCLWLVLVVGLSWVAVGEVFRCRFGLCRAVRIVLGD